MSNLQLTAYLSFNGNCEEAMKFYEGIFGGKLDFSRFGEFNPEMPEEHKNKIMHSTLDNGQLSFMASDSMPDRPVVFGDSVNISIAGDDDATLTKYFEGLSVGGTNIMPLEKQVWGDKFGMLTDKFGIHWMVNIGAAGEKPAA